MVLINYGPEAGATMKRLLRRTACTVSKSIEHLTPDPLLMERECHRTDTGLCIHFFRASIFSAIVNAHVLSS